MAPPARCTAAEAFAGRDPFLVLNSDNLYPASVLRSLVELDGPGLPACTTATRWCATAASLRIGSSALPLWKSIRRAT